MTTTGVHDPKLDPPLPPPAPEMVMATEEMLIPLTEESFQAVDGYPAFELRETGVDKLSRGIVNLRVLRVTPGAEPEASPWHMHHVGIQIAYILKGWARLEFEGLGEVRFEAGMVIYQPGMNRHRELETSPDFEAIEIVLPGSSPTTFWMYDEEASDYRGVTVEL